MRIPIVILALLLSAFVSHPVQAQQKSLVIGIDGLGYGEMGLGVASTPNLDRLIHGTFGGGAYRGASTDQAFAGGVVGTATEQPTVSGPGWSTILTGVWADRHLVTNNSFTNPDYVNNPPYLGSVKSSLPALKTASFVNWSPIDSPIINAVDIDADPSNDMNYRAVAPDATIAADAAAKITDVSRLDPDVIFVAFDDVDIAGHTCGSSGACYKAEIEDTDNLVGSLLSAIEGRPDFASEDWQIIVTADHGHRATGGHGGQSELERRIPFIVVSKTAQQGSLLPVPSPVSHADVAPTVLAHFGIAIPEHYAGFARGDLVGLAGDLNQDEQLNLADWFAFQAGAGAALDEKTPLEQYLLGDLNQDKRHSLEDFQIFRNLYVSAGGSAADLIAREIPEPTTFVLAALAVILLSRRRRAMASNR